MSTAGPLTAQHYACLYAWLAGLFAHEADEAQLARLRSPDTQAWLDLLCQQAPLRPALQHLQAALAALETRPDARLELAADFAGLFLLSQKRAALPYASCYQGETPRFRQAICVEMQSLLRQAGMQLNADFHEPEDHLSIFLELLSHLSFASAEQPEHQESERMQLRRTTLNLLLGWLPAFSARCVRYDPFGFYGALSQLLLALVQQDADLSAVERVSPAATPGPIAG
ncbi:molecular chaperone TorD [Edwardsiella piscicida]|uniref:molecular chaperone TorD n=1 Tax=Edwardsiella piscicida TaxID=1263550 RepID=UPI0009330C0A|nr:molecular chaperone TorD [Edwardsiella piscicida]EKS7814405.1 molecular chaperone TorD [Edwardsiella piscicida]UCQ21390.1 molecular chaperone TorD [Edwardsiella piscicida]WAM44974.1 molecular chaperone TorD [Edwardsiella piscicida]